VCLSSPKLPKIAQIGIYGQMIFNFGILWQFRRFWQFSCKVFAFLWRDLQ